MQRFRNKNTSLVYIEFERRQWLLSMLPPGGEPMIAEKYGVARGVVTGQFRNPRLYKPSRRDFMEYGFLLAKAHDEKECKGYGLTTFEDFLRSPIPVEFLTNISKAA